MVGFCGFVADSGGFDSFVWAWAGFGLTMFRRSRWVCPCLEALEDAWGFAGDAGCMEGVSCGAGRAPCKAAEAHSPKESLPGFAQKHCDEPCLLES